MKYSVDLHIHSALSPCGSEDMTPNNIVNMACLKGLDFIAVTDHNSAENVKAVMECASDKDLIVIPGMEIETREEVHLICLFPDLPSVLSMQQLIYRSLPDIRNREDIFGQQLVMDKTDRIVRRIDRMLLTAADLGVEDVFSAANALGGTVIPAHVDRDSYSILSNLGSVPEQLGIKFLELSRDCDMGVFLGKNPRLIEFRYIISSDAHYLGDILENTSFLELDEKSVDAFFQKFGMND